MKNILVFPCGSEVALEIHRSLRYSTHFALVGASSVSDHGRFVYEDYVGGLPFHTAPDFIEKMAALVRDRKIDAIYPAMDAVACTLKENEHLLGCRVMGSPVECTRMCASKISTYRALEGKVPLPAWSQSLADAPGFPVFIKPDVGYGSRNVTLARTREAAEEFVVVRGGEAGLVFCEYLPGREFTIDCFSDRHGRLQFAGPRERARVVNGISVSTRETGEHREAIARHAATINDTLKPRGAWFFQMKEDLAGELRLLEVAARLGGSSSLFRSKGVNFAMLTAFDAFDGDVAVEVNDYDAVLDRALSSRYRLDIAYDTVYVDYDDCILMKNGVNVEMVAFLFSVINAGKKVILITRHAGNIFESLERHRLAALFDQVIHLEKSQKKSDYIEAAAAIFIDDSFAERMDVRGVHGIPVFSPDMVEALM